MADWCFDDDGDDDDGEDLPSRLRDRKLMIRSRTKRWATNYIS